MVWFQCYLVIVDEWIRPHGSFRYRAWIRYSNHRDPIAADGKRWGTLRFLLSECGNDDLCVGGLFVFRFQIQIVITDRLHHAAVIQIQIIVVIVLDIA
jgi:hypothetical protein